MARSNPALTSEEQIASMVKGWPAFLVLHATPWSIIWRGVVSPICCPYEVQISYYAFEVPPLGIRHLSRRDTGTLRPYVQILSPQLSPLPGPNGEIPHKFWNTRQPHLPYLCLHLPGQWDASMPIAETIVPWTVEWLIAYEGWRATGSWAAGGHGTERRVA